MIKYTNEQLSEILNLYKNGEKVSVIAKKFGTSDAYISNLANKHGLRRRSLAKTSKIKICRNCRKRIDVPGAKFCPYCSNDIQTEREKLIEKTQALRRLIDFLPPGVQEEFDITTRELIKELSNDA
jgi:rRNA maturation endonuclease Nob1